MSTYEVVVRVGASVWYVVNTSTWQMVAECSSENHADTVAAALNAA